MNYYPPPQRDPGITFLGMSGGILFLTIAAVIITPILICLLCCGLGGLGVVWPVDPTVTPTP